MKQHSSTDSPEGSVSRQPPARDDGADAQWIGAALQQYERPLNQYAARLMHGDLERARDIVQDTFLKLWTAQRSEVDGHLGQWLYRVCRNRALDVCRKEARMTTLSETQADVREAASGPLSETRSALSMLQALSEKQQEVPRLKFQGDLSYAEIASVMDITTNHVGVLIHTGLKTLREKLTEELNVSRAKPQAVTGLQQAGDASALR